MPILLKHLNRVVSHDMLSFKMHSSKSTHHLFLASSDSSAFFPFNRTCDFQVELPEVLYLNGNWTCSLTQIGFKDEIAQDIIVMCDLCEGSFIRDTRLPVLRYIPQTSQKSFDFVEPHSFTVSRDEVKRLRVFIRTGELLEPSFIQNPVTCTLVLKRE